MAEEQLQDAIKLLQAGRREEARRQLMALLRENPEDENAWLVLSAAVDDPVRRRQALETALEINPENQIAQTQLEKLEPAVEPVVEEPEPVPLGEPGDIDDLPDFEEGEVEVEPEEVADPAVARVDSAPREAEPAEAGETETGRRSRWFLALAAIPLLCICVVLLMLLLNFPGG